jgi:enamine deaminase RidA (YjgF/YER057c/UK114 family)
MSDEIETRLATLGYTLPEAPPPAGNYVPFLISNGQLFISGQLSRGANGVEVKGRLGGGLGLDEGKKAAELCCVNILTQAKAALGSLGRIGQTLRLTGYINAVLEFKDHAQVLNGASDLMVAVLGNRGRHTRVAIGVGSIPLGYAVEIDAIFAIA